MATSILGMSYPLGIVLGQVRGGRVTGAVGAVGARDHSQGVTPLVIQYPEHIPYMNIMFFIPAAVGAVLGIVKVKHLCFHYNSAPLPISPASSPPSSTFFSSPSSPPIILLPLLLLPLLYLTLPPAGSKQSPPLPSQRQRGVRVAGAGTPHQEEVRGAPTRDRGARLRKEGPD